MPEIGEIQYGKDIGKGVVPYAKFIWHACEICGKERWADFRKGQVSHLRCHPCAINGKNNSNWKGGRLHATRGYIRLQLKPDDFFYPMADCAGYVFEHRLVMAKHLGRCLHSWEIVHHKGIRVKGKENRSDNLIDNLQIVSDDRHKQITILENQIAQLKQKIRTLQSDNIKLRREICQA